MKKIMLSVITLFILLCGFTTKSIAGNDKLFKHSGETLEVKVIRVTEFQIVYKYPGEDAEQTIGKLAVAKIVYGSGRTEQISEKIEVSGKGDWEKVQILTDLMQTVGLKKGEDVRGKTSGMLSYNTAGSADRKATKRMKEAAAETGAPFVLLTSDKADGYGIKQSIKNGSTYSYK